VRTATNQSTAPTKERLWETVGLLAALDRALSARAQAGQFPGYQSCQGEEAVLAGVAAAGDDSDYFFWGRQLNAAALWRGLSPERLVATDNAAEIAALRVIACTQGPAARLCHAAGLAWAGRKDGVVALCELGDGAVSDPDFHCGLNFAAVLNAPMVVVVRSEGGTPVALRAEGYGLRGEQIAGNDPEQVCDAVREAAERARRGEGGTLIEASVDRRMSTANKSLQTRYEDTVAAALCAFDRGPFDKNTAEESA